MNLPLMRRIDRMVGLGILRALTLFHRKAEQPRHPRRILIIKLFGFGNFIFLSPVYKALKRAFPDATLETLTFAPNRDICLMYADYIDRVHTLDFSLTRMGFQILGFAARHRGEFDIVIDCEQFVRLSALIARLCAPKYLVGMVTRNSHKDHGLDRAIYYAETRHVVEEFYEIAEDILGKAGVGPAEPPVLVSPRASETERTMALEREIPGWIPVGVCPGGRADDQERRYPKERFAKALELLLRDCSRIKVFFVGAEAERPDVDYIMQRLADTGRIVDATGLSLPESARIISRMRVFVSNDTGPIHLAASLGVHCVGLYGPSKDWIYGPYASARTILRDEIHTPVRSNHNEKMAGWHSTWWPAPERVASAIGQAVTDRA